MTITKIEEFLEIINELTGTGEYLYRGHADASWLLRSGAARRIFGSKKEDEIFDPYLVMPYLDDLLKNAKNRRYHRRKETELSDLELLAELQHYKAATFLLDFTRNPFVALWIACSSYKGDKENTPKKEPKIREEELRNGKVFILRIDNSLTKFNYQDVTNSLIDSIPERFEKEEICMWEPSHLNERIPVQSSVFLFGKEPLQPKMKDIRELIIHANSKTAILEELEEHYGINETCLFPDFYGFADSNNAERPNTWMKKFKKVFKEKDHKKRIDLWGNVILENCSFYLAYLYRGEENFNNNDYETALKDYNKALELKADFAKAYLFRGRLYMKTGEKDKARNDFLTAKKIAHKNEDNILLTIMDMNLKELDDLEAEKKKSSGSGEQPG